MRKTEPGVIITLCIQRPVSISIEKHRRVGQNINRNII